MRHAGDPPGRQTRGPPIPATNVAVLRLRCNYMCETTRGSPLGNNEVTSKRSSLSQCLGHRPSMSKQTQSTSDFRTGRWPVSARVLLTFKDWQRIELARRSRIAPVSGPLVGQRLSHGGELPTCNSANASRAYIDRPVTHVVMATCTCRRLPGASQARRPGLARRGLAAGGRRTLVGDAAEGVSGCHVHRVVRDTTYRRPLSCS